MSTKIENPTTKSNLAEELTPFIGNWSEDYRLTKCLFSQYDKFTLLHKYIEWNWVLNEKGVKCEVLGILIASLYDVICILEKLNVEYHNDLNTSIQNMYSYGINGANEIQSLIDKNLIKDHYECAHLTKEMLLNYQDSVNKK